VLKVPLNPNQSIRNTVKHELLDKRKRAGHTVQTDTNFRTTFLCERVINVLE